MTERLFTAEEIEYIRKNIKHMTQKQIAENLNTTSAMIKKLRESIGLSKDGEIVAGSDKICMECVWYVIGGVCGKTKRETGALISKSCWSDGK